MMHKLIRRYYLLTIFIMVSLISCKQVQKALLPTPEIKMGTARLSGKVIHYKKENDTDSTMFLVYTHPVSMELKKLSTAIKEDGSFFFECPMECTVAIGSLNSDIFRYSHVFVGLTEGELAKVEITLHGKDSISSVVQKNWLDMTWPIYHEVSYRMHLPYTTAGSTTDTTKQSKVPSPEKYRKIQKINLKKRLSRVEEDSLIAESTKKLTTDEFKLCFLNVALLNYRKVMHSFFDDKIKNFVPEEPQLSYYSFLKEFDLNNPLCLYWYEYVSLFESLFACKALDFPAIGDTPIDKWIKQIKKKAKLVELTGLKKGLFYELLVAQAYMMQFTEKTEPLSEKQKKNLQAYSFKNKDIVKILLAKNEKVIEYHKKKIPTVFNKTPIVPNEDLMKSIIAKYAGKVVVVDFWATWCSPCLSVMKETREIRNEMAGENLVFVFITGESSPLDIWREEAKKHPGEHYYLTTEQWDYLLNKFFFQGIPSYLYYDTTGILKSRVEGISNTRKMKHIIERILNE